MPTSLNTKKAVRVPDDIKGMKIAGMGDSLTLLKAAGASPVGMGANDWYMSLEKGVIEGCLAPIGVLTDRGVEKLTPNHVDMGIGQGGNVMIINLERWNSFPPDIKAKFEELNSWAADTALKANEDLITNAWKKCADQNIVKPTPEEKELWLGCAQPATDDWIEKNASKGPTAEMVEYTLKLIEEMK